MSPITNMTLEPFPFPAPISLLCITWQGSCDSSVSIATRYGLEGPGIESRWGRDFPYPSRPALESTQPPIPKGTGSFPGAKRLGRGVDQPPTSTAEVEGRVELYICSSSGSSWPVTGWNVVEDRPASFHSVSQICNWKHVAKKLPSKVCKSYDRCWFNL